MHFTSGLDMFLFWLAAADCSQTLIGLLVYWGLTPQQQPGSCQGGEMMMMKSVFWWRKPEYPEETTDLRQVTDETFHTYGLCPVRGLNLGRSGVMQSELRRDESDALAHRATAVPLTNAKRLMIVDLVRFGAGVRV